MRALLSFVALVVMVLAARDARAAAWSVRVDDITVDGPISPDDVRSHLGQATLDKVVACVERKPLENPVAHRIGVKLRVFESGRLMPLGADGDPSPSGTTGGHMSGCVASALLHSTPFEAKRQRSTVHLRLSLTPSSPTAKQRAEGVRSDRELASRAMADVLGAKLLPNRCAAAEHASVLFDDGTCLAHQAGAAMPAALPALPVNAGPVPRAPTVLLSDDGRVFLDGSVIAEVNDTGGRFLEWLTSKLRNAAHVNSAMEGKADPNATLDVVVVVVSKTAPWSRVRLVLRAIDAAGVKALAIVGKGECEPVTIDGFQPACLGAVLVDDDDGKQAAQGLDPASARFDAWWQRVLARP